VRRDKKTPYSPFTKGGRQIVHDAMPLLTRCYGGGRRYRKGAGFSRRYAPQNDRGSVNDGGRRASK